MSHIYRATAVLNHKSMKPEDAARNVWHFASEAELTSGQIANLATSVSGFYIALNARLAATLAGGTDDHRVEMAEIIAGSGGAPDTVSPLLGTVSFGGVGGAMSGPLPPQVAIVMSFQGVITGVPEESGLERPRSRRRGRLFLGPLNTSVVAADATTGEAYVTQTTREDILDAYDALDSSVQAIGVASLAHSVYSRTEGAAFNVTKVSVDNSFDIQRRRKVKRTIRMERTITPGTAQTGRSGVDVALAS